MTVEAHDPRPKKVQIADTLREEIAALPAGHRLASLRELADRFKVTTVTAGSALKVLADEGVIVSVPNRGTSYSPRQVRAKPRRTPAGRLTEKRSTPSAPRFDNLLPE